MVESFGRRVDVPPVEPGGQQLPNAVVEARVVPLLDEQALAHLAERIRDAVAEAVVAGFTRGWDYVVSNFDDNPS